jgi:hypothetical protein
MFNKNEIAGLEIMSPRDLMEKVSNGVGGYFVQCPGPNTGKVCFDAGSGLVEKLGDGFPVIVRWFDR